MRGAIAHDMKTVCDEWLLPWRPIGMKRVPIMYASPTTLQHRTCQMTDWSHTMFSAQLCALQVPISNNVSLAIVCNNGRSHPSAMHASCALLSPRLTCFTHELCALLTLKLTFFTYELCALLSLKLTIYTHQLCALLSLKLMIYTHHLCALLCLKLTFFTHELCAMLCPVTSIALYLINYSNWQLTRFLSNLNAGITEHLYYQEALQQVHIIQFNRTLYTTTYKRMHYNSWQQNRFRYGKERGEITSGCRRSWRSRMPILIPPSCARL